jgi:RNA polymerase sigma-70 factor, ECF subfamily
MSAVLKLVAGSSGGHSVAASEAARPDRAAADEDDALMARVAEGDQRAFARLVARHSPRAQALAHRFTGSSAEAEEIVQEAFWRVWRSAGRWAAGGAMFSTWLHRVVVNLCVDHDRRRRIRRLLPFADAFDPPSDEVGAERAVVGRGEMAAVRADIARLPPRQRAALLLSAEGERSNAEIARVLQTSEKAVESMLVRARRTLREKLGQRGEI